MEDFIVAKYRQRNLLAAIEEPLRELRTNILSMGKTCSSILFTSTKTGEGKSTLSLLLAISLCRCGKKVIWIDSDFHKKNSSISFYKKESKDTAIQNFGGIADYLSGSRALEDCIYKMEEEELDIIPRGNAEKMSSDLLANKSFPELLETLKKSYDYIILDCSAAGEYVDSKIVTSMCDGTVYVIGFNKVRRGRMQQTIEQLKKCKGNIIGAVLNKTRAL